MFTSYAVTLFRFTWIILWSYFYYIQYSITRDFNITCPTHEATTISYFVIIFKTLIWFSLPIPKLKERVKRDTAKPIGDVYQNLKKVKRNTAKPIWRWHFLYFTKAKYSSHRCTETLPSDILPPSKSQEMLFPRF